MMPSGAEAWERYDPNNRHPEKRVAFLSGFAEGAAASTCTSVTPDDAALSLLEALRKARCEGAREMLEALLPILEGNQ